MGGLCPLFYYEDLMLYVYHMFIGCRRIQVYICYFLSQEFELAIHLECVHVQAVLFL